MSPTRQAFNGATVECSQVFLFSPGENHMSVLFAFPSSSFTHTHILSTSLFFSPTRVQPKHPACRVRHLRPLRPPLAPLLLPPILPRRCERHFRAPMCDRSTHSHHILALYAEKPRLLKRNAGSSMFALTSIPPLRTLSCSLLLTWSIVCAPCITTTVSMVELVLAPSTGCARLFTTSTHCGNEIYF